MIAFWKYDQYPYLLSGTVKRVNEDGTVFVKEYMSNFKPVAVLPDVPGKEIARSLNNLRDEYSEKSAVLLGEFKDKAHLVWTNLYGA